MAATTDSPFKFPWGQHTLVMKISSLFLQIVEDFWTDFDVDNNKYKKNTCLG